MKKGYSIKKIVFHLTLVLSFTILFGNTEVQANNHHQVKSGETLFLIGQRYGVSASVIQRANNLTSTMIYPGQNLVIPTTGQTLTNTSPSSNYTVRAGDTLFLIGQRYNVSAQQIINANNLGSSVIYPGQNLVIPNGQSNFLAVASRGSVTSTTNQLSAADLDLLARLVHAEARGESYAGQVAVAAVVLNRLKSLAFPNSISGIVFEPGAFCVVADGQIHLRANQSAHNAVQDALKGWDPSNGAVFFYNPAGTTNKWMLSRPITTVIGNHIFAK